MFGLAFKPEKKSSSSYMVSEYHESYLLLANFSRLMYYIKTDDYSFVHLHFFALGNNNIRVNPLLLYILLRQ